MRVLARQPEEIAGLRWASIDAIANNDIVPGLTRAARKLAAVLRGAVD